MRGRLDPGRDPYRTLYFPPRRLLGELHPSAPVEIPEDPVVIEGEEVVGTDAALSNPLYIADGALLVVEDTSLVEVLA